MSKALTMQTVVEQAQTMLHNLVDLAEFQDEEFNGVVLDEIPLRYREATEASHWRITVEKIVARTKSGKTLTDSDIQALADEAEEGYDVTHLQSHFMEGFSEGRSDAEIIEEEDNDE